MELSKEDSLYIDRTRGWSIFRVVIGHLGLGWLYLPYTGFVTAFLPLLFFVSGAVTFYIYNKKGTKLAYTVKRVVSLLFPYYLIILSLFTIRWVYLGYVPSINFADIFAWLVISPTRDIMPFNLGQVWFLHTMILIILISIPFFSLAKRNINLLLIPIVISIILSFIQLYVPIDKYLISSYFNFYKPLTNIGFFCFGALFFYRKNWFTTKNICQLLVVSVATAIISNLYFSLEIRPALSAYSPNIYYVSVCYSAIFIFLLLKVPFTYVCDKFGALDWLLLFLSKNAYAVFILHSVFIHISEEFFGLVGVFGSPGLAATKILFVFVGSCVAAVPVTYFSRLLTRSLINRVLPK